MGSQFTGTAEKKMKKDLLLACYYRMKSSVLPQFSEILNLYFEPVLKDFGNFGSGSQV